MSQFLAGMTEIANWLFSFFGQIFNVYLAGTILAMPLALWLLRKVVNLVRKVY